jgi:hypothetical protein
MIELLKGSRITSSQSAAGTGPQGISQGGAHGSPRACRKAGTTGPGTYAISGDVIFEHIKATCLGVTRDASPPHLTAS